MMKTQLVNISVVQSSKFVATLYLILTIPVILFLAAAALSSGQGVGTALFMLAVLPGAYAVLAFVGTALTAWLYNVVAKRVGGIEFTTAEIADSAESVI